MTTPSGREIERLTDGSTYYWSRVFPTLWTILVGVIVALLWLDAFNDAAITLTVKTSATVIWAVLSTLFFRLFGRLQDVWLDGDDLLVGDDPRRGIRVSLREVREVKESRLRQVKNITLKLSRSTPLGDSITFVPKGLKTFLFPYASSPVADLLRARRQRLLTPG